MRPSGWRQWTREPLVQFLAVGAALFVLSAWIGDSGPGEEPIVVDRSRLRSISEELERGLGRPPVPEELAAAVTDFVREEVAVREATALGMGRDDPVVRRRLRQRLEALAERAAEVEPSEAELRAYFTQWPDLFRIQGRLPPFEEARAAVRRELAHTRRAAAIDGLYERLRAKYPEVRRGGDGAAAAGNGSPR